MSGLDCFDQGAYSFYVYWIFQQSLALERAGDNDTIGDGKQGGTIIQIGAAAHQDWCFRQGLAHGI